MIYVVNNGHEGGVHVDWDICVPLTRLGAQFKVIDHAAGVEEFQAERPSHVILSGGPYTLDYKTPSVTIQRICTNGSTQVLGICFGAWTMLERFKVPLFDFPVDAVPNRYRNKGHDLLEIEHDGTGLMEGIPSPFRGVLANRTTFESHPEIVIKAQTSMGEPVFFKHINLPVYGVQFHPEHPETEFGDVFLSNFLRQNSK